jgi:uncharacterized protein (TIGR02145 family)
MHSFYPKIACMKKRKINTKFMLVSLTVVMLTGFNTISLIAQEISFSFTANYTCEYAALDSVFIENLTQGGDTTLYFPDTVLTIVLTGIAPVSGGQNGYSVSQNYPNPFENKTDIEVFVPERDDYTLNVYDLSGRKIADYEGTHERGMQHFTFFAGNTKSSVLTVNSGKYLQHIQMIQFGEAGSGSPHIEYHGSTTTEAPKMRQKSLRSYFPYELEDELKFTAYVPGDYASITDSPSSSEDYFFDINNAAPSITSQPPDQQVVAGDNVSFGVTATGAGIIYQWQESTDNGSNWSNVGDGGSNPAYAGTSTAILELTNVPTGYDTYDYRCVVSGSCTPEDTSISANLSVSTTVTICGAETVVVGVTNLATGDTWMDRNLGASQQATSTDDYEAYGALFQWGRLSDGHECINWTSSTASDGEEQNHETPTLSSTDDPEHSDFIVVTDEPFDWHSPQNDDLWQGVSGINNPCPSGYRLPTETELNNELQSWSSSDEDGAYGSPIKLPVAGYRGSNTGSLITSYGCYWSSTIDGTQVQRLSFGSSNASISSRNRAQGYSVRCIKD